jgi:hypothetical protein
MTPHVVLKGKAKQFSVNSKSRSKNVEDDVDHHEPENERQPDLFGRIKTSVPDHGKG